MCGICERGERERYKRSREKCPIALSSSTGKGASPCRCNALGASVVPGSQPALGDRYLAVYRLLSLT